MNWRRRAFFAAIAAGWSVVLCLGVFYAAEFLASPYRAAPDGRMDGILYTWGHRVHINRFGFRERDFTTPKPVNVFRVMVLGDSYTWGVGLTSGERYTAVAEELLNRTNRTASDAIFEVLNFGIRGLTTLQERDVLMRWVSVVEPDLIVVGFCRNDLALRDSPRDASWLTMPGRIYRGTLRLMRTAGLRALSNLAYRGWYFINERIGAIPTRAEQMDILLNPGSVEWREFVGALRDIKRVADERGLPPPILAALNDDESELFPYAVAVHSAVEQAALDLGFVAYQHAADIRDQNIGLAEMRVNAHDRHPSAVLNRVYGAKLARTIAAMVERWPSVETAR